MSNADVLAIRGLQAALLDAAEALSARSAIEPPAGIPYVATLQFNYGTRQIRGTLTDAEIEAMCRPGPIVAVPCVVDAPSEEYKLLVRIADANVIFPSLCANNNDAYSINDALAKYKTKRISERNSE